MEKVETGKISWITAIAAMLILIVGLAGCGETTEVNVWAAASLKDALTELAPDFEKAKNVKLVYNFASSGDLQVQIEQGAPADLFLSAGKKQMDALEEGKLVDPASRLDLLGGDLVIAAPADSKLTISSVEAIGSNPDINRIAIGDPAQVPAGKYAQQSLEKANIRTALQPKLILAKDVRQVLTYVETGEVEIGFVYKSDMKVSTAKTAYLVPDSYHDPIVYPGAVVKNGKQPGLGGKFLDYLTGAKARSVFKKFGFKPLQQVK